MSGRRAKRLRLVFAALREIGPVIERLAAEEGFDLARLADLDDDLPPSQRRWWRRQVRELS